MIKPNWRLNNASMRNIEPNTLTGIKFETNSKFRLEANSKEEVEEEKSH